MKNSDSHIFLYAKGHYEKDDLIQDMKRIVGEMVNIESKYMCVGDIVQVLLNVVHPYIRSSHDFINFVLDLQASRYWKLTTGSDWELVASNDPYTFEKATIRKCLSILMMIKVHDYATGETFVELDDQDPSILPLSGK